MRLRDGRAAGRAFGDGANHTVLGEMWRNARVAKLCSSLLTKTGVTLQTRARSKYLSQYARTRTNHN
jgi:hypothetical protein